jgi:SAM-dependent methyltransferase/uncharacterized protein YbaR (Trm112 family)
MRFSTEEIASRLCCPDDQKALRSRNEALECRECGRIYPVQGGQILELLPTKPAAPWSNAEYAAEYDRQFQNTFETEEESRAWDMPETGPPSRKVHRDRQTRAVLAMLEGDGAALDGLVLCDVSAGAGNYTLAYARRFKWVFHCDLSVATLRYAAARSRGMGLTNVLFLRVDYFALPFSRSIDRLLCLDTLIRGNDHEKALLRQIQKALAPPGRAIIDFHHWWHNPLRRLGLLPQNFGTNRSYGRSRAEGLLLECGIEQWRLVRFYQELEASNAFSKRLAWFLPATRLVYELGAAVSGSAPDDGVAVSPSANSQQHRSAAARTTGKDH